MTNEYPAEWLGAAANINAIAPWQPTAAQRARVAEIAYRLVARDELCGMAFAPFIRDTQAEKCWPQMLVAVLELLDRALVGELGRPAAVARLTAELAAAQGAALAEAAL